jgi:hypothetical protein
MLGQRCIANALQTLFGTALFVEGALTTAATFRAVPD